MIKRVWPLLVLVLATGCGDDPVEPADPAGPMLLTVTTESWDFLDNRFFRLDLPGVEAPGRAAGERIDYDSVRIYRIVGGGVPEANDVVNAAVAIDTTGRWNDGGHIAGLPPAAWTTGLCWRPVDYTLVVEETGGPVAVDLGVEMTSVDILGVVYAVIDDTDEVVYRVGDRPGEDAPGLELNTLAFFRFKLLKADSREPFTFQYALRNVYYLGAENIQSCDFDLAIERNSDVANPGLENNGLSYLRIFGLDRYGPDGEGSADGFVDENDTQLFDLAHGLLRFPLDFPQPFAAAPEAYAANAGVPLDEFQWDETYLAHNLTPEIYDPSTLPSQYPNHGAFRLIATVGPG